MGNPTGKVRVVETKATDAVSLLTTDIREITDAIQTAWRAHQAWSLSRDQAVRLMADAVTTHGTCTVAPELGLAPILLESVITNPDIGNLQYLVRAIERRRTMEVEG